MIDTADILSRARRLAYTLGSDHVHPTAARAIGAGRHGREGEAFAQRVRERAGPSADEHAIDEAITHALRGKS